MKVSDINKIFDSFVLFVDHTLQQEGEAYKNHSSLFYKMNDTSFNNVYSSPFKQFVYDDSITGATKFSGIYASGSFVSGHQSYCRLDYWNGRVVSTGSLNAPVSGSYSVKDFNIYATEKPDEVLLFNTKFEINPSYTVALSGLSPNSVVAPCIFLNNASFHNEQAEFGGAVWTNLVVHSIIIADSRYSLESAANILIDKKDGNFCILPNTPFNEYGDLKSSGFNYTGYIAANSTSQACIKDAEFYKLNSKDFADKYPNLKVGFIDWDIAVFR